jgi:hypothetical protein
LTGTKRTLLLVLLGGALAVAGCGSEDEDKGEPIPADTAAILQEQLDNIEGRINGDNLGACEDILGGPRSPNVPSVQEALASLPQGVSSDLRAALEDGFDHLWELVQERCDELKAEQEQQDTETETVETITETIPTDTVETTTTETVPPPTTETVPPPTDEEPTPPEQVPPDNSGGAQAPEGQP